MDTPGDNTAAQPRKRLQPAADYRITFDGRDLSPIISPRLVSLSLTESRADEADTLDLVLDDSDNALAIPKRGVTIRLSLGWRGEVLMDKGAFIVDEVEHGGAPDTLTVRARSASMTAALRERRERSWHDQSLASIARSIAIRHGLKPAVANALEQIVIAHIDQTQESDIAFLTRLAKRYDAVTTVKDLRLLMMPIGAGKTASGKPLPTLTLTRASGDQHRYHVSQRESYTAVRAYWHSNGKAARQSVLIGEQDRKSVKVLPDEYPTEADARRAAEADFARTQRSQATMSYTMARGNASVFPEMPVEVAGFKDEINDTLWLIKQVSHTIADGGFVTTLELEVSGDLTTRRHRSRFRRSG
ncbi:phage protein D [Robbsia andropogonis]|uniref:phage late control D family protein n=1 Tax=Robbsia andropogonis TaxID=28092 RepID=UPI003D22ED5C